MLQLHPEGTHPVHTFANADVQAVYIFMCFTFNKGAKTADHSCWNIYYRIKTFKNTLNKKQNELLKIEK